jgi:hypothetical protein
MAWVCFRASMTGWRSGCPCVGRKVDATPDMAFRSRLLLATGRESTMRQVAEVALTAEDRRRQPAAGSQPGSRQGQAVR